MLKTGILLLILFAISVADASPIDFCPSRDNFPKNTGISIYKKNKSDIFYIVAASGLKNDFQDNKSSSEITLKAKREMIKFLELGEFNSDEEFIAKYNFQGLQTFQIVCRGVRLVIFVQDQNRLEKIIISDTSPHQNKKLRKIDPSQSAESNLIEMMRNR